MRLYELTYLISSNLAENEVKSLQEKINSLITENQGTLNEIKETIKKRLGSPIKKQDVAYLTTLNFYLNPNKLDSLEKKIKPEEQILHYIILSKKQQRVIGISRKIKTPSLSSTPLKTPEKPKKVEIKEIEKKLEEILGE